MNQLNVLRGLKIGSRHARDQEERYQRQRGKDM
jgi:hypothetical protein